MNRQNCQHCPHPPVYWFTRLLWDYSVCGLSQWETTLHCNVPVTSYDLQTYKINLCVSVFLTCLPGSVNDSESVVESFFYPSALRAGGVLSSRSGRAGGWAGGCQSCGTHISVTVWRIFSIRSSVELSRPLVVHCHGHLPLCPIWACPWAKNLSNLAQIGSRLCGTQISETAGWIYPI